LNAHMTLAQIPRFRGIWAARFSAWLALLRREAKEPREIPTCATFSAACN
jgi:hypothetical protein